MARRLRVEMRPSWAEHDGGSLIGCQDGRRCCCDGIHAFTVIEGGVSNAKSIGRGDDEGTIRIGSFRIYQHGEARLVKDESFETQGTKHDLT